MATSQHEMINSPFKWVGGKSRLRKQIIELLPQHTCYVELFGGAGWVLFGKQPSPVEILNDIDQNLITFFRVVKEKPEELLASFQWDLVSRAEFERLAALDVAQLSDVEKAHRFYYLVMAGWGGELNYPRLQTSITDGGGGNRLIGAMRTLKARLEPVHERLQSVIIECLSWRSCFDRYDRNGVVMYVDPPYPNNKCNYVHNMRSWEDHQVLADALKTARCKWIYSSYNIPEVHDLFSSFNIIPVESASGMNKEKQGITRVTNKEVLITNYTPEFITPEQNISVNLSRKKKSLSIKPSLDSDLFVEV